MANNPKPREWTVQYGATTFDDTNGIALNSVDRSYSNALDYRHGHFSCEFTLRLLTPSGNQATDNVTMAAQCAALEANLTLYRQRFLAKLGTGVIHDWNPDPAVVSAFHIESKVEKIGKLFDNGRRQRYSFSVSCDKPASLSGQAFRLESNAKQLYSINGRRVFVGSGLWSASAGLTALANYQANADAFFATRLPAPVAGGEWVKVNDAPEVDDEGSGVVCRATRTYWEVKNGLRDYAVSVSRGPSGRRAVRISGSYTKCFAFASAYSAFSADFPGVATAILSSFTGSWPSQGQPDQDEQNHTLTDEAFAFSRVFLEIVYPEGPGAPNDPNVGGGFSLRVTRRKTYEPQSFPQGIKVERVRRVSADYRAMIDITSSGGLDPANLWDSKYQQHALNAIKARLNVQNVIVVGEVVSPELVNNELQATVVCDVVVGQFLSCHVHERLVRLPATRYEPMADGTPYSYFQFRQPPEKRLFRMVTAEVTADQFGYGAAIDFFQGDASGYPLTSTGSTAEADLDAQEADGYTPSTPGWVCQRLEPDVLPGTRGLNDELQTVILVRIEEWLYVGNVVTPTPAVSS